ncbi:MAG TPA: hypothetical protein VKB93_19630 [Thermoanaerobaculia bacterium]|nr:hypothetical protein [Thermoanaerobaculia bacterium]
MKRTLATTLTLALALPLLAEEAKKAEEKPKTQPPAAATAQAGDSPLVAASKRANRLGKKSTSKVMITNETLKASGGNAHVTTTAKQTSLDAVIKQDPPAPTPEMVAAKQNAERQKLAAEEAAKKREEQQKRTQQVSTAAEEFEEEYPDDMDPAQAEKQMRDASAPQKPPR